MTRTARYAAIDRTEDAVRETKLAMTLRPNEATVLYNAACALGQMKKKAEAMDAPLRKAWEAGFKDPDWARHPPTSNFCTAILNSNGSTP